MCRGRCRLYRHHGMSLQNLPCSHAPPRNAKALRAAPLWIALDRIRGGSCFLYSKPLHNPYVGKLQAPCVEEYFKVFHSQAKEELARQQNVRCITSSRSRRDSLRSRCARLYSRFLANARPEAVFKYFSN